MKIHDILNEAGRMPREECSDCDGKGTTTTRKPGSLTTGNVVSKTTCDTCGGLGWLNPTPLKKRKRISEVDITTPNPNITMQQRPVPGWQQMVQQAMTRLHSKDPTHSQAAREALNRLQVLLKQKSVSPDEETIAQLAKTTETLNKLVQFLAAGGKPNPMESIRLAEGKRKRRKKSRLQKMYGRTRRGVGAFYGAPYYGWGGGGWGHDHSDHSGGDGGGGGGGDGGGGGGE